MASSNDDALLIVPARGGSKGIPRKNLALFQGKPLIQHTLETIEDAGLQQQTLVSTDDEEIATLCLERGFGTDYRRPRDLATDTSPVIDAVFHGVSWTMKFREAPVSSVMLLQPTSPRRRPAHLTDFLRLLESEADRSLVSVSPMMEHPMECAIVQDDGSWQFLVEPTTRSTGRQMYQGQYVFINGSMYGASLDYLEKWKTFFGSTRSVRLFTMESGYGLDIDEPHDLLRYPEIVE